MLRVDRLLCLGDLVGYHADPDEVIARMAARDPLVVAGNHDRTAIAERVPEYFSSEARHAIEWTRTALSPASRAYLRLLPTSRVVDEEILLVHGAVHPEPNVDVRLNTADAVGASFTGLARDFPRVRVCFFGHVHQQVVYRRSPAGPVRMEGSSVRLAPGVCHLVNPGSVGQPRDIDRTVAADHSSDTHRRDLQLEARACSHRHE